MVALIYLSMAIRVVVFACFALAALVAGTHWLVQTGKLQPFGGWPRFTRRLGDPFVRPIERRALSSGGNPAKAPYYFFWVTVLGGLAVIGLTQWLIETIYDLIGSASAGPMGLVALLVNGIFSLLTFALFIRIIGSWFGASRYSKPMGIVYALTDWVIEPIRRILPAFGPLDFSPMVAYFMLWLARGFLLNLLLR
ncbi:MAG: YggT family protein [Gemmatimonadales bacterium]